MWTNEEWEVQLVPRAFEKPIGQPDISTEALLDMSDPCFSLELFAADISSAIEVTHEDGLGKESRSYAPILFHANADLTRPTSYAPSSKVSRECISLYSMTTQDSGYQSDMDHKPGRRQRREVRKTASHLCPEPDCLFLSWQSQRELNVHRRRMHNKTPFPCLEPGCDRRNARGYVRETDLRSHQRKKHSQLSQSDETKLIGADGSNQSADTISTVMREPETAVGRPLESERARPTRAETRGSTQAISGTVTEEEEVFRVIDNVAENNDSSSTFAPSVETAHPRGDYSATDHNPAEDDDSFSASDYPRSPSPWQEMQRRVVDEHDNDAKANITHCMKWILHNRLPLMDQQSRFDVRSITDVDESGMTPHQQ